MCHVGAFNFFILYPRGCCSDHRSSPTIRMVVIVALVVAVYVSLRENLGDHQ